MDFQLVSPSVEYKESYLEALRAFKKEGLPWFMNINEFDVEVNFERFIKDFLDRPFRRTEVIVPETVWWAIVDGRFAGRISVRHELNENLKVEGGHIGYDTAPAYRGRGIASRMLKEVLPHAKKLGLSKVLLTCNDSNMHSIRVIEKNGGVLAGTKMIPGKGLKRYYWIDLEK